MNEGTSYYLGQGKLYIATRDSSGNIGLMRWLGDVSSAELTLKTETVDHKESYSGQRLTAKKIVVGKEGTFDYTLMELTPENLEMCLYGKNSQVAAGTQSDFVMNLPDVVKPGHHYALPHMSVTNLVLTDSAPQPATIDSSKYTLDSPFGTIEFLDSLAGLVRPIKATYSHGVMNSTAILGAAPEESFYRYQGVNLAENGSPVVLELYRAQNEPLKKLGMIGTKLGETQISSTVLIDTTKPADGPLGQFGRYLTA